MKRKSYIVGIIISLVFFHSCISDREHMVATIPFEMINGSMIIRVATNGFGISNFIFDTGTELPTIDSAYAKEIKLEPFAKRSILCAFSEKMMPIATCRLWIGELVLDCDSVNIQSTDKISKSLGIRINGSIGSEAFKNKYLKINFIDNVIEVFNPGYEPDVEDYECAVSYIGGPCIMAEVMMKNRKKMVHPKDA